MVAKQVRAAYTQEFRLEAVRLVQSGQSQMQVCQMELARLRAENARLRMERDIAKKAAAYFAQDVLRGMPGSTK